MLLFSWGGGKGVRGREGGYEAVARTAMRHCLRGAVVGLAGKVVHQPLEVVLNVPILFTQ